MLEIILNNIQQQIILEAKEQRGKFVYALSADEVCDVSNLEQLAIVILTANNAGKVNERLLKHYCLRFSDNL